MDILKIAKRADLFLGILFLAFAAYSLFQLNYLMAGIWFLAAAVSFASAKVVPAKWVLKKMLLSRKA